MDIREPGAACHSTLGSQAFATLFTRSEKVAFSHTHTISQVSCDMREPWTSLTDLPTVMVRCRGVLLQRVDIREDSPTER